ncbi:hypothetical protein KKA53_02240 [Candidatus Dependentiae bacterium]|nr:hypothetical protein [Candidatus Dependentiae bacterium]
MRIKLLLYAISIALIAFVFQGHSGERTKKLQVLHRQIGNNLIKIKKTHPRSQTLIFSVLDQLGKYHELSKGLVEKKKKYKQLLRAELTSGEQLKRDSEEMKTKMAKMKKMILLVHKKMKKDEVFTERLQKEKAALDGEREQFMKVKEKFDMEREKLQQERDALLQERNELLTQRENGLRDPQRDAGRQRDGVGLKRTRTRRREILQKPNPQMT